MPPTHARSYASPSYASPPLPVLVTQRDLPRALAVVVAGTLVVSWLGLQLDALYIDDQRTDFYFPCVRSCCCLRVMDRSIAVSGLRANATARVATARWGTSSSRTRRSWSSRDTSNTVRLAHSLRTSAPPYRARDTHKARTVTTVAPS